MGKGNWKQTTKQCTVCAVLSCALWCKNEWKTTQLYSLKTRQQSQSALLAASPVKIKLSISECVAITINSFEWIIKVHAPSGRIIQHAVGQHSINTRFYLQGLEVVVRLIYTYKTYTVPFGHVATKTQQDSNHFQYIPDMWKHWHARLQNENVLWWWRAEKMWT